MSSSEVSSALREVRAALAEGHTCPVVIQRYLHPQVTEDDGMEFCPSCPDGKRIPRKCPELTRDPEDRRGVCALYTDNHGTVAEYLCGRCGYGRRGECPCFQPKSPEWYEARRAWYARQERLLERDERIGQGREDHEQQDEPCATVAR